MEETWQWGFGVGQRDEAHIRKSGNLYLRGRAWGGGSVSGWKLTERKHWG